MVLWLKKSGAWFEQLKAPIEAPKANHSQDSAWKNVSVQDDFHIGTVHGQLCDRDLRILSAAVL